MAQFSTMTTCFPCGRARRSSLWVGKVATTKKATLRYNQVVTWMPDWWRLSNCAICRSDVSIVRPYFNKSSREISSRSVLRLTLVDVHFSTSWILISLSMSPNSQFRASSRRRMWNWSNVSSSRCCACRKTCVSYMMFFLGEKYSVSFSIAFFKVFTFACFGKVLENGVHFWASQI